MMHVAIPLAYALIALAIVFCMVRLVRGPSAPDRILALDTLSVNAIAFLVVLGVDQGSAIYFEAALLIAMMGFVGTVALAKFLLRGDVIE